LDQEWDRSLAPHAFSTEWGEVMRFRTGSLRRFDATAELNATRIA
jgi:hypothetical protein